MIEMRQGDMAVEVWPRAVKKLRKVTVAAFTKSLFDLMEVVGATRATVACTTDVIRVYVSCPIGQTYQLRVPAP